MKTSEYLRHLADQIDDSDLLSHHINIHADAEAVHGIGVSRMVETGYGTVDIRLEFKNWENALKFSKAVVGVFE